MNESPTALLILDFQQGLADQPWARCALANAESALAAARHHQLPAIFSKVKFEPGYLDVSPRSKAFGPYRDNDHLPPDASHLTDRFTPTDEEAVVDKNRFSPFTGSRLESILRAQSITRVVLAGISTSGVILGAFTHGEDTDLRMTILTDACADPNIDLHDTLIRELFPRSAHMQTTAQWAADLDPRNETTSDTSRMSLCKTVRSFACEAGRPQG